jgi:murein tripeptide amidase MpaA
MPIKISYHFDAGAIDVLHADAPDQIELALRADSHAPDCMQWFYFRLQGARNQACIMRIVNAGAATFAAGWEHYQAVASYDRERWFRVPTTYDGHTLTIRHTPQSDSVYYAYFEPYSWERHLNLLGRAAISPLASVVDLGNTVDGRDMNLQPILTAVRNM